MSACSLEISWRLQMLSHKTQPHYQKHHAMKANTHHYQQQIRNQIKPFDKATIEKEYY